MTAFHIDIQPDTGAEIDDVRSIAVRVGTLVLTRLLRPNQNEPDDYLRAPPAQLAFWFVDNWWRLRWECVPPEGMTPEWRLAHELSSIGGGYAWPRLSIWGESERVGLMSRSDPAEVMGPVRFLTDALLFVAASEFEDVLDRFLDAVANKDVGYDSDRTALRSLVDALKVERADAEIADWRRMEARLGFDPDAAPEALMEGMAMLIERYGQAGVEEAAMAAPGTEAAEALRREIEAAEASRWTCDFSVAVGAAGALQHTPTDPPWKSAENAAQALRRALSISPGPLRNGRLSELLGVRQDVFRSTTSSRPDLAYGLRLKSGQTDVIALRSRWSHDRRFELTRALGDKIWAETDTLGPLARSRTARQKFQRAFAQSLLCPFDSLIEYMGTDSPNEGDISAAARHFHVAERVVQTVLVNKHVIGRQQFEDMVEAA